MLDAIGAGLAPRIGDRDWAEIWLDSPEYQRSLEEIKQIKEGALLTPEKEDRETTTCTPFCSKT